MPRVSVISTGQVRIRPQHERSNGTPLAWWLFTSRRWTGPRPINVYVIEHRDGLVLFDTGQDRHSVTDPDYFPGGLTRLPYRRLARFDIAADQTLTAQLGQLGYEPSDVTIAILSHLHQDHIGGLPELRGSRILVGAAEWATLDAPLPELNGLMGSHIRIPGLAWEQVAFNPTAGRDARTVRQRPRPFRRRQPGSPADAGSHPRLALAPPAAAGYGTDAVRR